MTPAHVFMTVDAVGGVWTYALDLADGLAGEGVRVTLAVLGPNATPAQAAAARTIAGLTLIETGLPLDWTASDAAILAAGARKLGAVARRSGADLIHLNSPALAADARFHAPVLGVCHSDLASWWAAVRGGEPPADFRWRINALTRGYAACDALVAPSAAFAAETARLYGVRPAVARNGRRAAVASSGQRDRCVLTSGRLWDEGKNVATLDAAAARLDAPVVALGSLDGPAGERVTLRNARSLGRVSEADVADQLGRASIFCSLALYEPFGLGVLEAAQAGCALVLSDIATFRELWSDVAVFVDPRDEMEAASALQSLLDDPADARRLGGLATERAAAYSMEAMTAGVLEAYAGLLARVEVAA